MGPPGLEQQVRPSLIWLIDWRQELTPSMAHQHLLTQAAVSLGLVAEAPLDQHGDIAMAAEVAAWDVPVAPTALLASTPVELPMDRAL